MTIADSIKAARTSAGLSQRKLARLSGVASNTICQYESGARVPRLAQLSMIAAALGVSVDYLLADKPAEGAMAADAQEAALLGAFAAMDRQARDHLVLRLVQMTLGKDIRKNAK